MSNADLQIFFSQLATLLDAGVPIRQALESLAAGRHRATGRLCEDLERGVAQGGSLADALRGTSERFPPEYIAVIAAGESSGRLPELLRSLKTEVERRREYNRSLAQGLSYPLFVMLLGLVACPLYIAVSDGLLAYLLLELALLGPLVAIAIVVWLLWRRDRAPASLADPLERITLAMPWVGTSLRRLSLGRGLQLLGLMQEAGVGLRESLSLVAPALAFRQLTAQLREVASRIEQGDTVAEAMEAIPALGDLERLEVATGETSGTLDRAFRLAGDHLIESAWSRLRTMAKLTPIVAIIVLGLVVFVLFYRVLFGAARGLGL